MIETDKLVAVDRIIAPQSKSAQEEALERALRPKRLADYTGQEKIREQLEIFIQAAKQRGDALDDAPLLRREFKRLRPASPPGTPEQDGVHRH